MSRVALLTAAELGVEVKLRPVLDLLSERSSDYGGNPSLKVPVLIAADGPRFGAMNCCRCLAVLSGDKDALVWPEHMGDVLLDNTLEVVRDGMMTEVVLVMSRIGAEGPSSGDNEPRHYRKARASLESGLAWLERELPNIVQALEKRPGLSFLEVSLFCYLDHLEWRQVRELTDFPRLRGYRDRFAKRPSAQATAFRFDA